MVSKTVLFVSHTSKLYGAERSLLTLVENLQRTDSITPIVLFPNKGPLVHLMREAGIKVVIWPYFHWIGRNSFNRFFLGPVRFVLNLISLALIHNTINQLKPNIIYTNTLASPFGAFIAMRYKVSHIWHAREFVHEDMHWDYDFGTRLSMVLVAKASKVICNSYAVRTKLNQWIKKDIFEVVYNGFNFDFRTGNEISTKFDRCVIKRNPVTLLMVGQIHSGKGVDDAIRALAVLISKGHSIELSIVGSGKKRYIDFMKGLSKRLSVDDKVVWHGFDDNPKTYFNDAAVVLVCSRCEAFGRGTVEAMAAGTPVVATDTGGTPEVIEDGITGMLYNPGDYEALTIQIECLLKDRELYENIAKSGQHSATKRFAVDRYASGIKNIIEQI